MGTMQNDAVSRLTLINALPKVPYYIGVCFTEKQLSMYWDSALLF